MILLKSFGTKTVVMAVPIPTLPEDADSNRCPCVVACKSAYLSDGERSVPANPRSLICAAELSYISSALFAEFLFIATLLVVELTFKTLESTVKSPATVKEDSVPTEVMLV